jgi:hypothetical protein
MNSLSRCLAGSAVVLLAVAVSSVSLARGGHREGKGAGGEASSLCGSAIFLNLSLSNLDLMIKTTASQTAALEELKKIAKENSDNMARVCADDNSITLTEKLYAAEKRLDAALEGNRKIESVAQKFYATLSDTQKSQVNDLVDWPGL